MLEELNRHGATSSERTSLHVHVDSSVLRHSPGAYQRLLGLFDGYRELLTRIGTNPGADGHRPHRYARPYWIEPSTDDSRTDRNLVAYLRGDKERAVSLIGVTFSADDHVEVRLFDGALDLGVVQTTVRLAQWLIHDAVHGTTPVPAPQRIGGRCDPEQPVPERVNGYRVFPAGSPEHERELADFLTTVVGDPAHRAQIAALYRLNPWGLPPRPAPDTFLDADQLDESLTPIEQYDRIARHDRIVGVWLAPRHSDGRQVRSPEATREWRAVSGAHIPDGMFSVHLHGSEGYGYTNRGRVNPELLAKVLLDRYGWNAAGYFLPACEGLRALDDPTSFAWRFRNAVQAPVRASPDNVWVCPHNGTVIASGSGGISTGGHPLPLLTKQSEPTGLFYDLPAQRDAAPVPALSRYGTRAIKMAGSCACTRPAPSPAAALRTPDHTATGTGTGRARAGITPSTSRRR